MKSKFLCMALTIMTVVSGTLSGCGNTVISDQENASIEFSWWGNDVRHNYTMDGVDLFQEKEKNIDVSYRYGEWSGYETKTRVWMESHTEADVMQINYAWLNSYSADGNGFYDLNELKDYIDFSSFDEADLTYGMKNGKLNAIPIAFNTSSICFNKDLYDKYNLDYPTTWEDLFAVSEVFSKDNIYTLGMAKKHLLLMLIAYYEQTTGKKVFDENGKLLIDEEGFGYILDFYKELIDKKVIMPVDQFERGKFGKGEVASSVFWISDADNYCSSLSSNGGTPEFGNYIMAENAKQSGIYMKPATMYAISSVTECPEEAAKLLNYLLNDATMARLQGTEKGVPVSKIAIEALKQEGSLDTFGYVAYEKMQENKDKLQVMIPIMESEDVLNAFKENADAYIYGVQDRDTTTKAIYEDILNIVNK